MTALETLLYLIATIGALAFVFALLGAVAELAEKVSDSE